MEKSMIEASVLDEMYEIETLNEYMPQLENIIPVHSKEPTKNVAMWTDNSTLALISCYEARKGDLDHPIKRGKVWGAIVDDLLQFGYKFSGEQIRWKFNSLTRKYKECIDASKRTGAAAVTFKFFKQMDSILGASRIVKGQNTISSTLCTKKCKTNDNIASRSTLSTLDMNIDKKQSSQQCSRTEKKEVVTSKTSVTENKPCNSGAGTIEVEKRPHGSGSRIASNKLQLEKQWLQHLQSVEERHKIKETKREIHEKRKAEEREMKLKYLDLKEKQIQIAKRKHEETIDYHTKKLKIEKQKCRLLKEILKTRKSSTVKHNSDISTDSSP